MLFHDYASSAFGGAFGDIGLAPGVEVNFTNHDAYNDFVAGLAGNHWRDGGGGWSGISANDLALFSEAALGAIRPAGRAAVSAFVARAQPMADALSKLQVFPSLFGRSAAQDRQYRSTMTMLRQLILDSITTISNANRRDAAQAAADAEAANVAAISPTVSTGGGSTTGVRPTVFQQPDFTALMKMGIQQQTDALSAQPTGLPKWALPAAGAAAVGLVGLFFLTRRPSRPLGGGYAGYRTRRRRVRRRR